MRFSVYGNSNNAGIITQYINEFFLAADFPVPAINTYTNEKSLLENVLQCNMLFIDTSESGTDYFSLIKAARCLNMNVIFFVFSPTYDFLNDAMSLNVFRYMTIPIDRLIFFTNLRQAINLYSHNPSTVAIENKSSVHILPTNDITYIEQYLGSSLIHTTHGLYKSHQRIQYWEELLPETFFIKINPKNIINAHYILEFNKKELSLNDEDKSILSVNSGYVNKLKRCINNMLA